MSHIANILKQAFDPFYEAPIAAWNDFASAGSVIEYPAGTILKKAGDTERYFYFILNGSAGIFLWKENNFVCLDLAFENGFFGDYMSILTRQASLLETMTLENSNLFRLKSEDYLNLCKTEIGTILSRAAAESSYIAKQQQQIELLTQTAEQSYLNLLNKSPDIEKRIAQKHLASYLGITPQSFSRIRKKRSQLP
jgi:CRP/FNR family transcriptional regulator, anaerobic regulatory protein